MNNFFQKHLKLSIPFIYLGYINNFIYENKFGNQNHSNTTYCFDNFSQKHKQVLFNKDNSLFIWGNGKVTNTSEYTNFHPHRIKKAITVDNKDISNMFVDVIFGEHLCLGIDKNQEAYIWREPRLNSEKIEQIDNHSRRELIKLPIKQKVINAQFTLTKMFLLTADGKVFMYNIDINYPHVDYLAINIPDPDVSMDYKNPIEIKELKNIKMIATGIDHFLALDNNGDVWGMGDDSYGQLGLGLYSEERKLQMRDYSNFISRRERIPKKIQFPEKIKKIVCGENHSLALSVSNQVYGFGYNRYLQLSNDNLYRQKLIGLDKPTLMSNNEKFNNYDIIDIEASNNCSFFVCKDRTDQSYSFFSCGEGLRGQLGQNLIKHISDIEIMPDISGLINGDTMTPFEPLKLNCGKNHCILLYKNPRVVYVWGNNEFGELGTKDRIFYESPIPMLEEYNLPYNIVNISAGYNNSAFIAKKIDKDIKKEILNKDKANYEEELKKRRRRKKVVKQEEKEKKDENNEENKAFYSNSVNSLKAFFKKYF